MNKVESYVYNMVRKNPKLKQWVRDAYQGVFDLLPRQKEFFKNDYQCNEGYFFGFHDVSPFSADETKVLACHASFDFSMPRQLEGLEIGYFEFKDGRMGAYHKLGHSYAWNWHKGCRLQWLDNETFIYNTAIDRQLKACIDTIGGKSRIIDYPIDSVYYTQERQLATSFSYERLQRCMPGYGYPYRHEGRVEECAPMDDGLYLIDLQANTRELLVSLHDLSLTADDADAKDYLHFVTHTEFSGDGRYISFLYRRTALRNAEQQAMLTRLVIYDLESKTLHTLPTENSGSHYVWTRQGKIVGSFILNGMSCHALFDVQDDTCQVIAPEILNSDGHQTMLGDTAFITDTYPDKRRMARLYRMDIPSERVELLANTYSPKRFQTRHLDCHIACDLHPRVSPSGKYLSFDSPRTGKRGLYVMKL
ncbi:MAG: hypothetical protein J1E58_08710 [Prevotella sp.]|nr:hypothetical protein [Prevotella sp.]